MATPEPSLFCPPPLSSEWLIWPCVFNHCHVGRSKCFLCAVFRLMSANCHQFLWISLCFCSSYIPKTLKIHLHVSKYKLCTFPIDFVDFPPNIAFMVLTINFTFGLITSNDLLLTYFWPNDILFCGPGSVMAFFYFCASASLLQILNLSCHFLAVKPVFQLK